jgi:hypothetical protein
LLAEWKSLDFIGTNARKILIFIPIGKINDSFPITKGFLTPHIMDMIQKIAINGTIRLKFEASNRATCPNRG